MAKVSVSAPKNFEAAMAELDLLVARGFDFLKSHLGVSRAKKIATSLLRMRHDCSAVIKCISEKQVQAINIFNQLGSRLDLPPWAPAVAEPTYDEIKHTFALVSDRKRS